MRPDGRAHSRCVACFKEQVAENYVRNRESKREKENATRAANPEKYRARDRARYARRREQQASYLREWRARNRDKVNAYEAKRRAKAKGSGEAVSIDREEIYERDAGRCHICGKRVPRSAYTLDHLVPLSKGGDHTPENLAVAHRVCNSQRFTGRIPAQLRLIG